jgi:hypothetical protein
MNRPHEFGDSLGLAAEVGALCDHFEQAWQRGQRPDLVRWLPPEGRLRQAALVELARVDLDYRLRSGEAARVEDYFTPFPELRADPALALPLIAVEARARAQRESGLSFGEYQDHQRSLASGTTTGGVAPVHSARHFGAPESGAETARQRGCAGRLGPA